MKLLGAVACGHPLIAEAAAEILCEGGNAFDAVVAANFVACVVEPVFTSLGGGGYLLASTHHRQVVVYDFFVQTPRTCPPEVDLDFRPVTADFGTEQQVFHVGIGAAATPGMVRGLFAAQRDLCTMPMRTLLEPAIKAAKEGVMVNDLQAYAFRVVGPIYVLTESARALFTSRAVEGAMLQAGEFLRQPELADTLEALGYEGDRLFYEGEIAQRITRLCHDAGGQLSALDLSAYRLMHRAPLEIAYRGAQLLTNPPPSRGGTLIAFALKLLETCEPRACGFRKAEYLKLLVHVMQLANEARQCVEQPRDSRACNVFDPAYLDRYRMALQHHPCCRRGTTHISVIDAVGNVGSLSSSNGEGCGHLIPGTGIMLNNMLGEEDLCPQGFHHWPKNARMGSMMAPSLLRLPGHDIVLGSGGSNRIRSAILQVLINLVDHGMSLAEAVASPRIHFEGGLLSAEGGFVEREIEQLVADFPQHKLWEERNLFFGGVHAVLREPSGFIGVGDPRRGGAALVVSH